MKPTDPRVIVALDFANPMHALALADPKELGIPAYGKSKGAPSPGPGAAEGPGLPGQAAQPGAAPVEEKPHNPADDMPDEFTGRPL